MISVAVKKPVYFLSIALLLACLLAGHAMPALAAEGDNAPGFTVDGDMEPGPGDGPIEPPESDAPPIYSEPDPPSSDAPVDPPSSEPPSESSDDPYSEPSSQPPEEDEPSSEPPVYYEPEDPGIAAPVRTPNPTPRSSGTLSKPTVSRQKVTLNSASTQPASQAAGTQEPNYITFAQLNQKANSMSITLFYSGAGCILLGILGLLTLLVFFIRNRRADERDGIFEEIAQAEQRRPDAYPPHQPHQLGQAPRPAAPEGYQTQGRQPVSYGAAPQQDSLYTEEFDLSPEPPAHYDGPMPPAQDSLYTEEFELPPQSADGYAPPPQDSLYTEEFQLPQVPAHASRVIDTAPPPVQADPPLVGDGLPPVRHSQTPPPAQMASPAPVDPYDTEEILRELLNK